MKLLVLDWDSDKYGVRTRKERILAGNYAPEFGQFLAKYVAGLTGDFEKISSCSLPQIQPSWPDCDVAVTVHFHFHFRSLLFVVVESIGCCNIFRHGLAFVCAA